MLRRGQVHGIHGRLEALEARQASRRVIPLAIRRHGILEASDGRLFPTMAALLAATGQTRPPLAIEGPEVAQYDR